MKRADADTSEMLIVKARLPSVVRNIGQSHRLDAVPLLDLVLSDGVLLHNLPTKKKELLVDQDVSPVPGEGSCSPFCQTASLLPSEFDANRAATKKKSLSLPTGLQNNCCGICGSTG